MKFKTWGKIYVDHGIKKEIHERLGVSYPTIRKALNGEITIAYKAAQVRSKVRKVAIELGGKEVELEN
ncbi:hypothetical protein [Tannerella forsythia]|uniref:hypothetical protein n=1 Tax=Tannerella forsythia TaxID=28112 RepID=UPI0028E826A1|nr:hypothetical protein [Tannerella forsythia]